ncbi:MAG TPA: IniB N-terminal domain-containing protein [Actinophytocola sp.]|uniref:IniB N-terminal domain-containing protein n=1 Tax=Actinophytocola sp. TaxID=1872138 RepID=UPI002DB93B1F|nr:IniB N-terminal domain-containing protein [Actinophytocola sp.]HEU5469342.1 IniB N-terminal domain-containing protein [Actinophytocola sp.]
MQVIDTLVEFLMSLMSDEETQAAFAADPEGVLAAARLDGITGADVRDARLMMADGGGLRCTGDEWTGSTHHDAVREIQHTTKHYEVTDQTFNFVNIDDRDTLINDSFNDSFNSDDDGVDTDTTNVVAIQDNDTDIDVIDVDNPVVRPDPEPESEPAAVVEEEVAFEPEPVPEPIPAPVEDELLADEVEPADDPDLDHAAIG